jgi:hypothetical protein
MIDILSQNVVKMALSGDEDPIGALAADAADPAFSKRVSPRRPDRRRDDPDADGAEYLVKPGGELGVPVPDGELQLAGTWADVHEQSTALADSTWPE